MQIQVRTPGTGWATYSKEDGEAVAEAFRDMGIEVETRDVPSQEKGADHEQR